MGDAPDNRLYAEFNAGDPEDKGIRPGFFQWDLFSIPAGSTINSATMHIYLNNRSAPDVTDYSVSRLLPGKDWVESDAYYAPANAGELTFNSQKHGVAGWQVPGARGAADVDIPGRVFFDAINLGDDLEIALDISSMVTQWVTNGVENNGVVVGGGTITGEVVGGERWEIGFRENDDPLWRPYLEIDYTEIPEPTAGLLLGAGLLLAVRRRPRQEPAL